MKVLQDVVPHGMPAQSELMNAITTLIRTHSLKKIIETGSYLGNGTTRAIADAMVGDEEVYSIEINPGFHLLARDNHKGSKINFLLGCSVPNSKKPIDFTFNVPDHVYVDHYDSNRNMMYRNEVGFDGPDEMLKYALSKFDFRPDLVILDSAGHMGWVEFMELMKYAQGSFYLVLDDTNHVKHYNTVKYLQDNGIQPLWTTDQTPGSAIFHITTA